MTEYLHGDPNIFCQTEDLDKLSQCNIHFLLVMAAKFLMCQSNLASWIARSLINTFAEMPCQYQDTWVGEFCCCCLKYFLTCPTSQIDGVAQNLCVFLGSRPNIFESFVTSPMFAVRSCYKSILSIAILFHPLCQILKIQCSKQRHYYLDGNDCYHQMVFLSWSVVLNTEERPSRQKLLS